MRAWDLENQTQILTSDFNHLTAENAMKAADIHPAENTFDWTEADRIADFARQHCMKLTGHALLWHRQAPAWMFKGIVAKDPASLSTLKARLKAHIDAVVARYADVVDNWDVVNEASVLSHRQRALIDVAHLSSRSQAGDGFNPTLS